MIKTSNKSVWTDTNHKDHGKTAIIGAFDDANMTYSLRVEILGDKYSPEGIRKYCTDRFNLDVAKGNTNPEHGIVQTIHSIAVGVRDGGFGPNHVNCAKIIEVLKEPDLKKARKQTKSARRSMGKVLKELGYTPMASTPYKV